MGQRGINARPIAIRPTAEVLANRDPQPWEKAGLSRAEKVAVFLETLPVSSGSQRGSKFRLRDWQWKEIIEPIYRTDGAGRRYVREAVISMPRKNGKTGLVSGLVLCHLVGPEAVERGQIFSAANAKKQAGLVFAEVAAMVRRREWMGQRINVKSFTKEMEDLGITESRYSALAAEAMTEFGHSASFWIYDELGQAKNRALYEALSTSGGAWEEPLGVIISTQAPVSLHIMSELIDDAMQIKDGVVDDPSRYGCIFQAPMTADPWSEETWQACNPALGDFRSMEEMRDYAKKAKRIPAMEMTFRNLYLNQRVSKDVRWIPKPVWDACGEDYTLDDIRHRPCIGALDLSGSGKNDLTADVLLFEMEDGTLRAWPLFWAAENALEAAEHRDKVPYRLWAKQGHLLTTPGDVLDFRGVCLQLRELGIALGPQAVDPYALPHFTRAAEEVGLDLTLMKWGQGYPDMHPAIQAANSFILSRKLRHNRNPVLTWCIDNVQVVSDAQGNQKFDKRKATGRIDGAQALAMACGLHALAPVEPSYAVTWI